MHQHACVWCGVCVFVFRLLNSCLCLPAPACMCVWVCVSARKHMCVCVHACMCVNVGVHAGMCGHMLGSVCVWMFSVHALMHRVLFFVLICYLDVCRCDPPCIPYLGMYLTDLSFIEEGTPNFTEEKLVNFSKMRMVGSSFSSPCSPVPVYPHWLTNNYILIYKMLVCISVVHFVCVRCGCVCVWVGVALCVCVALHVGVGVWECVCACACMCTHTCVCVCVCVCVCKQSFGLFRLLQRSRLNQVYWTMIFPSIY